jgi:MATE family multidrug resistance protein
MLFVVAWRHARTAGTPTHTWPGFTSRALRGWGHYLQYGIPAAAMICCEW